MGLTTAIGAALSGLKATQAGLDLVAANVSNATTPGYVKKSLATEASVVGGATTGVKVDAIRREIDLYLQRQLRTETSGATYADTRARYLDRLQTSFGAPGSDLSIDALVSGFSASLDSLATSPDDQNARAAVLQEAQLLAQSLNGASADVQTLRGEADQGLKDGVDAANEALETIDALSELIVKANVTGGDATGLLDQRDQAVNQLASLMDIRVEAAGDGDLRVKTQSGLTLYDGSPATLAYDGGGTVGPDSRYATDPAKRTIGTVTITRRSGASVDLLADGQLRSGSLRALADLRDVALPQAQTQLDELAANLAQALGANVIAGAATAGGGVDLTTEGALPGDRLSVAYASGGASRSVSVVNVGDPSKLPLADGLTADPNDVVVGVDFSSPTAAADITAALAAKGVGISATASAAGFAFAPTTAGVAVSGGSSAITATALSGDGLALPVFVDGSGDQPYSGSLDGGVQRTGFAGRITVNPALLDDPSALTRYAPGVAASDSARVDQLRDALGADRSYLSDTGLGGAASPFRGSLAEFAQGLVANQAAASATASRVSDGQALVVSSLEDRFSSESGVDVDEEMGRLIQFQTAYSANARVVTAVKDMLDMLMRM